MCRYPLNSSAELIQAFEARKARTALSKTLKRPEYPEKQVKIADFVRLNRERDKIWKGPVRVVYVDNNIVDFVYEGSSSGAARIAARKVLPPVSTLVDPDGIEEELAQRYACHLQIPILCRSYLSKINR
jgi:hypothetical protein